MTAFLSIIAIRTFLQKNIHIKSTVLPEISNKGAEKVLLAQTENRMLLQPIRILQM